MTRISIREHRPLDLVPTGESNADGKRNANEDGPSTSTAETETGIQSDNASPLSSPHTPQTIPTSIGPNPPEDTVNPPISLEVPVPVVGNLLPVRDSGQHPPIGQSHRELMRYVLETRLSSRRLRPLLELYDITILYRPEDMLAQIRDFVGGRICETDWKGNKLENAIFEIIHRSLRAYLRRLGVHDISYGKNTRGGTGLMIEAFYDVGKPRPKFPSWLKREWLVLSEGRCTDYSPQSANPRLEPGHQTYNTTSLEPYAGTVGPIMQAVMRNDSINKYILTASHTLNDFAESIVVRQPYSLISEAVVSVLKKFRRIGGRPLGRAAEAKGMLDDVCICRISECDNELF